jgi:hypothetical protein
VRSLTRRVAIDLTVIILMALQEALMHVLSERFEAILDLISNNILVIRVSSAIGLACVRAVAEVWIIKKTWPSWGAAVEWIVVFIAGYIAVCGLDVLWHPQDNFVTVFAVNLLLVLVPGLAVSTTAYLAVQNVAKKRFGTP